MSFEDESDIFRCVVTGRDAQPVLALSGPLDLVSASELTDQMHAVAEGGGPVVLDITKLSFVDSQGLNALLRAVAAGIHVMLTGSNRQLERLLTVSGVAEMFPSVTPPGGGTKSIHLECGPNAVRVARRWLAEVFVEYDVASETARDAVLLVSELVTNAVIHAQSEVEVTVTRDSDEIVVAVDDDNPAPPRLAQPDLAGAPGGRGLHIVEQLSKRWGIAPTTRGKSVWFAVAAG